MVEKNGKEKMATGGEKKPPVFSGVEDFKNAANLLFGLISPRCFVGVGGWGGKLS